MDDISATNNEEFQEGCVAAMDLGTNSNRLLIMDKRGNIVFRDVRHVALGDGLAENGCFCSEAMERAICSFMDFAEMMKVHHVEKYRAIATAACRMSSNTAQFKKDVKESSSIEIEVISEYEEARLTLKGASLNAPKDKKYLLVYDLGGGSTEVSLALNGEKPQILHTVSIPLGARNATEMFELEDYYSERAEKLAQATREYMADFLDAIKAYDLAGNVALIATSSTPLRLAAWILEHGKYDKFEADGKCVPVKALDKLIAEILPLSYEKRAESVYIGQSRAKIFVAACVIFQTIYQALGAEELIASLKGAQEAIVSELL